MKLFSKFILIIKLYRFSGNKESFDFVGSYKETSEQKNKMKDLLMNFVQNDIIDFDDHFQDAEMDWKNSKLDKYFN